MTSLALDRWQNEVLEHKGNIAIRSGRQVGKSTVIAMKAARFANEHPGTVTMVIAAAQRQSSLLFDKIRSEVDDMKMEYAEPPTLSRMVFKNGSKIFTLPAGRTGYFIRGFTLDLLIADEAAYIPEEVWKAVIPMIAVSRKARGFGWIILLSTPFGKGGYFASSFDDPDFRTFHISSENCPRIPVDFLEKERKRMTKQEYAQEYLGEFIDEWNAFFDTKLLKECASIVNWETETDKKADCRYYLGVDIARYGGDENAFVVAELDRRDHVNIVKFLTTSRVSTTDTIGRVLKLDEIFHFNKVFIDDAGIGGGPTDILIEKIGRRVVGLNNAKRSVDKEEHMKGILKEDLYSNALVLMESGHLKMLYHVDALRSLKSVRYEYTADKNIKLFGQYTHIAEAFVRACWCVREKGLRLFLA
jgi:GGDEF domain-containing protein